MFHRYSYSSLVSCLHYYKFRAEDFIIKYSLWYHAVLLHITLKWIDRKEPEILQVYKLRFQSILLQLISTKQLKKTENRHLEIDILMTSWRSEVVEAEIRKINVMSRLQLLKYSNQVRCHGWFRSMGRKWSASSHTRHDDLKNDIKSIHSSLQSRLDGKLLNLTKSWSQSPYV